jgi:para-aminobenzoate synthetase/4-amino-4-deoxychorismate lyase
MADLHELAEGFNTNELRASQRVRLTLSRTGDIEITHSELSGSSHPVIDPIAAPAQEDARDLPVVVFSDKRTDPKSPYLFHKTTLRKLYDDERAQAVAKGHYEVLFINEKGEVTEGSYTNVFLLNKGKFITPPVLSGLLPGVFRKYLLQKYPEFVEEASFTREDIEQADALYVGNSVRGLVRVKIIEDLSAYEAADD